MHTPTRRLMFAATLFALQAAAAPAPRHPVSVTFGKETFSDPYDWMETQGPEYLAWVRAQNVVARKTLGAAPGYAALAAQVSAASDANTNITNVQPVGDQIYYEKQGHGDAQPSLYSRGAAGGPERRLADPVALGDTTTSIHEYAVSPDNRRLAICLATGGSEDAVLHIMDITSGKMLPDHIDRARAAGPIWSQDGSALFYNRLKASFSSPSDRFFDETIFRHLPGDDPSHDVPVFTAAGAGSALGRAAFIGIVVIPGAEYALAFANTGVSKEAEWFVAPAASLTGRSPRWQRVASLADKIVLTLDGNSGIQPVIRGTQAWFPSLKDAPRGTIVRIDLAHPGANPPTIVVPQKEGRLAGLAGTKNALYLSYGSGSSYILARTGYEGGQASTIPLPYDATVEGLSADPRAGNAVVGLES